LRGPSGNRPREGSSSSGWREVALLLDIEGGDLAAGVITCWRIVDRKCHSLCEWQLLKALRAPCGPMPQYIDLGGPRRDSATWPLARPCASQWPLLATHWALGMHARARPGARDSRGSGCALRPLTSCAIRGARGRGFGHRSPAGSWGGPGGSWARLSVGCGPGGPTWPLDRLVRWPVTPNGTGAGSSAPPPYRRLPAGG
jgi:hypothetical protein